MATRTTIIANVYISVTLKLILKRLHKGKLFIGVNNGVDVFVFVEMRLEIQASTRSLRRLDGQQTIHFCQCILNIIFFSHN